VTRAALIPTACPVGPDFQSAYRRPFAEIVHYDRW